MKILRIGLGLVMVAAVAVGGMAAVKLSNPDLPAAQPVSSVVELDQGWSAEDRARYHFTAQGTLLMPLAWVQAMERGFFSSEKLFAPDSLSGLRELNDGVSPGQPWNAAGLPIGWSVDSWASPATPDGPKLAKVGFNCAACHTGQINYKGVALRIEGGGALHDAGTLQEMVGKALLATNYLPWKRSRFLDAVSAATGAPRDVVSAQLSGAAAKAFAAVKQSFATKLYEPEGYGRLDALQRIANTVFADDLLEPSNNRHGDGQVKFPYIWDIWRLDWVQYNASVRQPMVRNVGEALGVRAETNFVDENGLTIAAPQRWASSVHVRNLEWMEDTLQKLRPPVWPEAVLGKIDRTLAASGRGLFETHCAGCHGIHVAQDRNPAEWVVTSIPVEKIGTNPNAATNFKTHTYSGAKLGRGELVAADALSLVTEAVKNNRYAALNLTPAQIAAADGFGRKNEVRDNLVYKARPLVGIWATPPYLHNGAVPTLFDLLSPTRPASFTIGSREYDPVHVGYDITPFPGGQTLDTTKPGNSNAGHWFTNDTRPGAIATELTPGQRMALIEYLKSASYAEYPCTDVASRQALTGAMCGG